MQDKNSNPLRLLFIAKSESDLSKTALPAIKISSPSKDILLKFLLNFITTPSKKLSVISVFEPAPKMNSFSLLFNFFKKRANSFNELAL